MVPSLSDVTGATDVTSEHTPVIVEWRRALWGETGGPGRGISCPEPALLHLRMVRYARLFRTLHAALLIAALATLAACGQSRLPAGTPVPTEAAEGRGLLTFSAPAVGGGVIDGQDYSGQDVAIWFWAPW